MSQTQTKFYVKGFNTTLCVKLPYNLRNGLLSLLYNSHLKPRKRKIYVDQLLKLKDAEDLYLNLISQGFNSGDKIIRIMGTNQDTELYKLTIKKHVKD